MNLERRACVSSLLAAFARAACLDDVRLERQQEIESFFLEFACDAAPAFSNRRKGDLCAPVKRALLEHRLQAAMYYARLHDADGLARQLEHEDTNWVTICDGAVALWQANHSTSVGRLGDAPAYIVGTPSAVEADDISRRLSEHAFQAAGAAGLQSLFESVGILVLVRERAMFGVSNSWTTTALRSTIYSDYVADPVAFGTELVHEAAHLWLNEALVATGNIRQSRARFNSPWKGEPRKAFGFVHATFAFSIVVVYLQWALCAPAISRKCRKYLSALAIRETQRLLAVGDDLPGALKLVDSRLAHLIEEVHERAIASSEPVA